MTNDNDLIRRGNALTVVDDYEFQAFIRALPAVAASQTADPVIKSDSCQPIDVDRFNVCLSLDGNTATATMERDEDGYWVRVSDYEALATIDTQPDPRDAVIAQLAKAVEALREITESSATYQERAKARAVLAEIEKGGAA